MTLNKYNEAMEYVTVSDEMKSRIMSNIQSADLNKSKIVRFPNLKKFIALAASLVIIIAGVFAVNQLNKKPETENPSVGTAGVDNAWGAAEYKNAKALSKASGIKIRDLKNLPFKANETTYQDYKNNLAEITYSDGTQSIYYRVSKGSVDNSGDYNEYKKIYTKEINGITVTFKENGGLIFLALYEKDGFSYSIGSTRGLTEQQIKKMI